MTIFNLHSSKFIGCTRHTNIFFKKNLICVEIDWFFNFKIVNLLIDFVESDDPDWKGYLYTVLISVVSVLVTLLQAATFYRQVLEKSMVSRIFLFMK